MPLFLNNISIFYGNISDCFFFLIGIYVSNINDFLNVYEMFIFKYFILIFLYNF